MIYGEMAEWSIASDLKSDELTGSVSSNLTLSFLIFLVICNVDNYSFLAFISRFFIIHYNIYC